MADVNYFVLGEIFGLLERIELLDDVLMGDFDPDDGKDVDILVERFIRPSIMEASDANREAIARAIAYYSVSKSAPFQLMKDRCQELTLPDSECWPTFFDGVGRRLFGDGYRDRFAGEKVVECPDENASETILARLARD